MSIALNFCYLFQFFHGLFNTKHISDAATIFILDSNLLFFKMFYLCLNFRVSRFDLFLFFDFI